MLPDSPTPRERVAAEAAERFVARAYQAVGLREIAVDRPMIGESTALGAAFLAGLHMGIYGSLEDIARKRQARDKFLPAMRAERRVALLTGWNSAVRRVATRS